MSLNLDKSRWTRVKFGEVVFNVNSTVRDAEAAGIDRVIAMDHLDPGELRIQRWGAVEDGTTFTRRVRPGQTLFGKRRAYQRKVAYAEFDAICSGDILTFQANEARMLPKFLPFLVQSDGFFAHALGTSAGSLSPRTNWTDLSDFEFDLPPLEEQKQLADVVWALEENRRMLQSAMTAADTVRSVVRNTLFASLSETEVQFDSMCLIPSQNGAALTKSGRAGETPMVNMGEMFRGEVISLTSDYERVSSPGQNFMLSEGDLLFARRSVVFEGAGACCLVPTLNEPYTFESSVIRSRVNSDIVNPSYILHFFRSTRGRELMSTIVRRGPVSGIAGSDLRRLEIPLPDTKEQSRIVDLITASGATETALERQFEATNTLLSRMLTNIFGGAQ